MKKRKFVKTIDSENISDNKNEKKKQMFNSFHKLPNNNKVQHNSYMHDIEYNSLFYMNSYVKIDD